MTYKIYVRTNSVGATIGRPLFLLLHFSGGKTPPLRSLMLIFVGEGLPLPRFQILICGMIFCIKKGNSLRLFPCEARKNPPPKREPPKLAYSLRGTPHIREAKISLHWISLLNQSHEIIILCFFVLQKQTNPRLPSTGSSAIGGEGVPHKGKLTF